MGKGHIEQLPSGRFRAAVYAGKDPVTGKKIYLKETLPSESLAIEAQNRMLAQVEAGTHPNRSATVATLMKAWMEVADHELTTRETRLRPPGRAGRHRPERSSMGCGPGRIS
jgi:integrase